MAPGQTHILAIEDEEDILALVHFNLVKAGFQVSCATSGEEGLKLARTLRPDLVLLDLMLPGMDGLAVCRALRKDPDMAEIPIVMLTAKGEEGDVVAGLEQGADDYLSKPFSAKVLTARIQAVLRRRKISRRSEEPLRAGDLLIHPGKRDVLVRGEGVSLTDTEFRLLHFLASRPGWVFTRDQIVNAVRGQDYAVTDRAVDVQVVGLRKKLGSCGDYIETVRGVGYRFRE